MKEPKPVPCPGCNGTGQTTYFGGVSRFLLSYEDCPECNGVGFLKPEPDDNLISEFTTSHLAGQWIIGYDPSTGL